MASYLSWDVLFQKSYYANGKDELVKNVEAMEELENIGKPLAREADGPAQIGSFNQNPTGTGFPNAGVMAQSWNTELSRDMGRQSQRKQVSLAIAAGMHRRSISTAVLLMAETMNIIQKTAFFPGKCAGQR